MLKIMCRCAVTPSKTPAEDGGIRAYAERQGQYHHNREAGAPGHLADRVADVLSEGIEHRFVTRLARVNWEDKGKDGAMRAAAQRGRFGRFDRGMRPVECPVLGCGVAKADTGKRHGP
jgi:hypothetical protein